MERGKGLGYLGYGAARELWQRPFSDGNVGQRPNRKVLPDFVGALLEPACVHELRPVSFIKIAKGRIELDIRLHAWAVVLEQVRNVVARAAHEVQITFS
jgi:hypothetical protein